MSNNLSVILSVLLDQVDSLDLGDRSITFLKRLTFDELIDFTKYGVSNDILRLDIDSVRFERLIDSWQKHCKEQVMIREYIEHGASAPMMRVLFGHNAYEVKLLRESLGLTEKGGRPQTPTEKEQVLISQVWSESYHMDEREHYLYVAKKTGISLRVIWNEINSYDTKMFDYPLNTTRTPKEDRKSIKHQKTSTIKVESKRRLNSV